MEELLSIGAGFAAVIAALLSFWSAANVERLRARFEVQRQEFNAELQRGLAELSLKNDRIRKAYELHVKNEYELYQDVYPRLLDAYYKFTSTKPIDSEPDLLEKISPEGTDRSAEEIQDLRASKLKEALDQLSFMDGIAKKKPFIHSDIFSEIEKFWHMGLDTYMVRNYPALYRSPLKSDKREYTDDELKSQLDEICAAIKRRMQVVDE